MPELEKCDTCGKPTYLKRGMIITCQDPDCPSRDECDHDHDHIDPRAIAVYDDGSGNQILNDGTILDKD